MPLFSFRVQFDLAIGNKFNVQDHMIPLNLPDYPKQVILGNLADAPLNDAKTVTIQSDNWDSLDEATKASEEAKIAILMAFMRLRLGIDMRNRTPQGGLTKEGSMILAERMGAPVYNANYGTMVFETQPQLYFIHGEAHGASLHPISSLEGALGHYLKNPPKLSDKEILAIELYNAAFFEPSAYSKFLLYVMAVEALLSPKSKSPEAIQLVSQLTLMVNNSQLQTDEKKSMASSMQYLKQQSIGRAGRDLAAERLGKKIYHGLEAEYFFRQCYDLRSRIVHGSQSQPSWIEVGQVSMHLCGFVADLLAAPFGPL